MQLASSGDPVPLTAPRSLLGSRPLTTDGTWIALFSHKTLYVVDRHGHVVAHLPQEAPRGVAFAKDRLVVDQSLSALRVYNVRAGTKFLRHLDFPKRRPLGTLARGRFWESSRISRRQDQRGRDLGANSSPAAPSLRRPHRDRREDSRGFGDVSDRTACSHGTRRRPPRHPLHDLGGASSAVSVRYRPELTHREAAV